MNKRRLTALILVLLLLIVVGAGVWLAAVDTNTVSFAGQVHDRRRHEAAVLLSGDAGFMGAGPGIAKSVEGLGVPVLGVSSLNRFRTRRTLPQAAAIVDGAVRSAMQKYSADRILLVGHSFGADVVAATLPDLSPDVRKSLVGVVVIVPSVPVYLKADPTSLSYRGKPDVARVQAVGWVRIVCIRGKLETDSMCPQLTGPNVTHIILPGGHALHHDTARLRSTLEAATAGMLNGRAQ